MLSIEIIGALGVLLGLLTGAMVRTQLHRRRLAVLRGEGQGAKA
jgi:hypothetical protein